MERRKFLGGAAAGVVAGAATTVGVGKSQAQTKSDATKPDADSLYHSHEGGSPSHSLLPSDPALRVKAMETLLLEKGLIDAAAVDAMIDQYENKLGPKIGAAVVAKAWADPARTLFPAWLNTLHLRNPNACSASRGMRMFSRLP